MNRFARVVLPAACLVLLGAVGIRAQESAVGELRIVDASGAETGREDAPPGEKHFRLPSGSTGFRIAFDFEGTAATPVQVRVMGPSGTVLLQEEAEYDEPGTYTIDFGGDEPLADQEYVVNVYLGADPYLADSLQLVVGEGELPGPVGSQATPGPADATESSAQLEVDPVVGEPSDAGADIPGGPSRRLLALAGAGVVVLGLIVVWAGWSATRR